MEPYNTSMRPKTKIEARRLIGPCPCAIDDEVQFATRTRRTRGVIATIPEIKRGGDMIQVRNPGLWAHV
jgi:hypothetical protein